MSGDQLRLPQALGDKDEGLQLEDQAEPTAGSDRERAPRPGYYYDDGTGYELYDPDEDKEERNEDDQENAEEKR